MIYKHDSGIIERIRKHTTIQFLNAITPLSLAIAVVSIVFAVYTFWAEIDLRRQTMINLSWERLEAGRGKTGDVGQVEAFANLVEIGFAFENVDLSGISLRHLKLPESSKLPQIILADGNLTDSVLPDAILDKAILTGSHFERSILRGASFRKANLTRAVFERAVLDDADFTEAYANRTSFRRAELNGAILIKARVEDGELSHAELARAELAGAILEGCQCFGTNFEGANARSAVFKGANLVNADFSSADLTEAILAKSILEDVLFEESDLTNADLSGADVTGASFRAVVGLKQEQLNKACYSIASKPPIFSINSKYELPPLCKEQAYEVMQ